MAREKGGARRLVAVMWIASLAVHLCEGEPQPAFRQWGNSSDGIHLFLTFDSHVTASEIDNLSESATNAQPGRSCHCVHTSWKLVGWQSGSRDMEHHLPPSSLLPSLKCLPITANSCGREGTIRLCVGCRLITRFPLASRAPWHRTFKVCSVRPRSKHNTTRSKRSSVLPETSP